MMPDRKGEAIEADKTGEAGEFSGAMLSKASSLIDHNFHVYDLTDLHFVPVSVFSNCTFIGFTFILSFFFYVFFSISSIL